MTEEIMIREARVEDAEAIAIVQVKTWQRSYAAIFPAERLIALDQELDRRIERWESVVRGAERLSVTYVAETGNRQIVGFANAGKQVKPNFPHDAELFAIYILPDYHGKGIGRR